MKITNLQIESSTKSIVVDDKECHIKLYAPIAQKIASAELIASIAFDEDTERFIPYKSDIVFDTELISLYTDIEFDEGVTLMERYDYLTSTGLKLIIINTIPKFELDSFRKMVNDLIVAKEKYLSSLSHGIKAIAGIKINENDINNMESSLKRLSGMDILNNNNVE